MTTIALAIAAAAVALGVAAKLRLPSAALAIVAGLGLRLSPVPLDIELVRSGLLLSATFLIFASGSEIDRENIARYRRPALVVTALYLLVTTLLGLLVWRVVQLDLFTLTYLVLALASSSTLVAVDLFRQREQFYEPVGRVVRAISLTQDAAIIGILSLFVVIVDADISTPHAFLGAAVLGLATWLTKAKLAPAALIGSKLSEEERLLFVLALIFVFVAVCWWAQLPFVLGVFLAGMGLSAFPVGGTVRSNVVSFSDFFTTLFFVFLGSFIDLPDFAHLGAELILVGGVFLSRPLLLLPMLRRLGMTTRSSIEATASLTNAGELALLVMLIGLEAGHIREELLTLLAAVVVVTMSAAPLVSSHRVIHRLIRWYPGRKSVPRTPTRHDHIVVIGGGETGDLVLEHLEAQQTPLVVIDEDPGVVDQLRARGVDAIRGDAAVSTVLKEADVDRAAIIVSTLPRLADNLRLLSSLPEKPTLVRVFSEDEAQRIREKGGTPVVDATIATAAFFEWFDEQKL